MNDPLAKTVVNPRASERGSQGAAARSEGVVPAPEPPPLRELVVTIRDNGLVRATVMAAIEKAVNSGRFHSSEELIRHLIRRGQITDWQGQRLLAGRTGFWVGPYLLQRLLGSGGMGVVLKARRDGWSDPVAIKVLSRTMLRKETARLRFQREVEAALALQHPCIVRALEAGCLNGVPYLVMEYLRGKDLRNIVRSRGPLPMDLACDLTVQIAEGLAYAHRKGLVHRDIKPANIFVTQETRHQPLQVKILDFGLALTCGECWDEAALTRSDQIFGTVDFISPEQARSAHSVDARSDIFSLGCTLYYLLTGMLPFGGTTVMEKITARFTDPPTPIERYRSDLPSGLVDIVMSMLARRPEDRWPDCESLASALRTYSRHAARRGGVLLAQSVLTAPNLPDVGADGSEQALERFLAELQKRQPPTANGDEAVAAGSLLVQGDRPPRSARNRRRNKRALRWLLYRRQVLQWVWERRWASSAIAAVLLCLLAIVPSSSPTQKPMPTPRGGAGDGAGAAQRQPRGGVREVRAENVGTIADGSIRGRPEASATFGSRASLSTRPVFGWPADWGASVSGETFFGYRNVAELCDASQAFGVRRIGRVRVEPGAPLLFGGGMLKVKDPAGWIGATVARSEAFSVEVVLACEGITASPATIVAAQRRDGDASSVLWELRQDGPTLQWVLEGTAVNEILPLVPAPRRAPAHLLIVDTPERVEVYFNGALALDHRRDAARTLPEGQWELTVGGLPGAETWRGSIVRLAVYPRTLSVEEGRCLLAVARRHILRMTRRKVR